MKTFTLAGVLVANLMISLASHGTNSAMQTILAIDSTDTNGAVIWSTEPGVRYDLHVSTNLMTGWQPVSGFPRIAQGLAQHHDIDIHEAGYYLIDGLDEQPPTITAQSPAPADFAVTTNAAISISLYDPSGIDSNSIVVMIGNQGPFTVQDAQVTFQTNTVLLNAAGALNWGGAGQTVTGVLVVADTLGNSGTNEWVFELALPVQPASNMFIFGSSTAQNNGQSLSGAASTLASRFGPGKRASAQNETWELLAVYSNRIVISYSSPTAPVFTIGQLIANLAPNRLDEIFYRRIDSMSDDTNTKQLTLYTTEVDLSWFLPDGSFKLSDDFVVFHTDTNGAVITAKLRDFDRTYQLPIIGGDFSDSTVYDHGGVSVTLPEAILTYDSSLRVAVKNTGVQINSVDIQLAGNIEVACVPRVEVSAQYDDEVVKTLWDGSVNYLAAVSGVPVIIRVTSSIDAIADLNLSGTAMMQAGFRQNGYLAVGSRFDRHANPKVTWDRIGRWDPTVIVPFSYNLSGQGSMSLALTPQIDVRLYAMAGFYVNVDPRIEVTGSATMANGVVTSDDWQLAAYADINAGLSVVGFNQADLPALEPYRLYTREWAQRTASGGAGNPALEILRQPLSQTVRAGDSALMSVEASGPGPLYYRWYHQGILIPGQNGNELRIPQTQIGHAGEYKVTVIGNGTSVESEVAIFTIDQKGIELADAFQYPIGNRQPMPEFPPGTANERNDLYPHNPAGNTLGRTDLARSSGWYNYQDVGSFYNVQGGIHPGEDWNKVGGDTGEPVYPIAKGRVVQIAPTSGIGANPSAQAWRLVIEHVLDGAVRKPGDAAAYYSIYAHITANPSGAVSPDATAFPFKVGDAVRIDQPIGWIAAITAPHLHLELREKVDTISASIPLWPNTGGRGYYSDANGTFMSSMNASQVATAFSLMRNKGIIDPSDFIDDHQTIEPPGEAGDYMVIDLSGGSSASSYPVTYLSTVPPGGWTDEYKTTKLVMRRIPTGSFTMGSPPNELGRISDEAQRQVTLTKDFYIGVFEVTQKQWELVMGTWPSLFNNTSYRESRPVERVSYYDIRENPANSAISPSWPQSSQVHANSFMGKLRVKTGLMTLDLPTESQWEYACRAGTTTALNSGQNLTSRSSDPAMDVVGRYNSNHPGGFDSSSSVSTYGGTAKVGSYQANAWGLYDMHGNVWEWCLDWYGTYLGTETDPPGAASGWVRIPRGGHWGNDARACRSAMRYGGDPSNRSGSFGFRTARTLP